MISVPRPATTHRSDRIVRLLWLVLAVVAAGSWTPVVVRVVLAPHSLSLRALVAWLACALTGVALGRVLSSLGAARVRRPGRPGPAASEEALPGFFLLLGLAQLAWGLAPALRAHPTLVDWLQLAAAVTGGLALGVVLMVTGSRGSGAGRPRTSTTGSTGG